VAKQLTDIVGVVLVAMVFVTAHISNSKQLK